MARPFRTISYSRPTAPRLLRSDLADFATWVAYTSAEWRAPEVVAAYLRTLEDGGAAYATIRSAQVPPESAITNEPAHTTTGNNRFRHI